MSSAELLMGARWLLALVMVLAGMRKLPTNARESTTNALENYRVLPRSLSGPVAAMLPWVEIVLASLLFAGTMVTVAAGCTAVLFAVFAAIVGWHLVHGRRFGCGCGSDGVISWTLVGRDSALSALALVVAVDVTGGLAIRPAWESTTSHTPALVLLPIPLLVIVAMITIRLLQEAASVFRATPASKRTGNF